MCDGQFRLMQNYLREQKDNILTINLVGEVASFAQVCVCVCVSRVDVMIKCYLSQ